ncbi:hypothetical protein GOP47_0001316 [Adiantum capillus-veneris]|uniref:Uncharacterized protein n=1 Tax=Adiantum capillus-veneris TaxID=13818 RepID=A0A9D4V9G8_ADICA|nr:hypothetical protein GOP47_0001316 [Adiantum capillus-veneris]
MAYSRGGVQSMEIDAKKKCESCTVYSEPNFVIQPSFSKGKGQACGAQVGCSKAQKAKMVIVKIERHDALIDTKDNEVKVDPFSQQEPHIEEHDVPFLHIIDLSGITLRFAIEEHFEIYANSTCGELLVVDGSTLKDRATLIFVNDRKEEYKSIKKEVDNGEVKTFVARNVGAFLGRENTLLRVSVIGSVRRLAFL